MAGVATAIVGSAIIGGISSYQQGKAAAKAAELQANAANNASNLEYKTFLQQQALMQPWVDSGRNANALLQYQMFGQTPTPGSMRLDPNALAYTSAVEANPNYANRSDLVLYQNPFTGEVSDTPPDVSRYLQGTPGGLNPGNFTIDDFRNSLESQVYGGARDASARLATDAIQAQNAAQGMGNLNNSGNVQNALMQNLGQLYAQYDPQALNAFTGRKTNQFNMLSGMANPNGAQQVGNYAGNMAQNVGNNMINAGNAQAQGAIGQANAWSSGLQGLNNAGMSAVGQMQQNKMYQNYLDTIGGSTSAPSIPTWNPSYNGTLSAPASTPIQLGN